MFLKKMAFSLITALSLSFISVFCFVRLTDVAVEDYRYGYLLYMARSVEKASEKKPIAYINVEGVTPPSFKANEKLSLAEASEFGLSPQKKGPRPSLWLVSSSGMVLSSNTNHSLPVAWKELPHPKEVHEIGSSENVLFDPRTFVVRLDTSPRTYLVSHNDRSLFQGPFLWIQGIHTFLTAALAVFLALTISFFYLRRKSKDARKVLARLESGDLKARFEVKRFDEFGNLILDFNRMADEIEKLVYRIHDIESSRSNLLQELGHDVRTPLTSLGTSFETLRSFHDQLTQGERDELYTMIGSDIRYFQDLLDKLTIIATIEIPHYKTNRESLDLAQLMEKELKNRQFTSNNSLEWSFYQRGTNSPLLYGDPHLILRLLKNAFDNASRYAQESIQVALHTYHDRFEITVTDDGPGLSPEAIDSFGKRRERRQLKDREKGNFSLGLGSVIMKAIAQVHNGFVVIENAPGPETGARLKIVLGQNFLK